MLGLGLAIKGSKFDFRDCVAFRMSWLQVLSDLESAAGVLSLIRMLQLYTRIIPGLLLQHS